MNDNVHYYIQCNYYIHTIITFIYNNIIVIYIYIIHTIIVFIITYLRKNCMELMTHFHSFRSSIVWFCCCCCSVTQSCLTLCDPHGLQHARLFCLSPSPWACSNSCPLIRWYHPTISSSVVPFSSCLQSFPASGSFLMMSWLFASGGQITGASASASVLPVNIQNWFPLGLTGLISLQSKGLSRVFSNTRV